MDTLGLAAWAINSLSQVYISQSLESIGEQEKLHLVEKTIEMLKEGCEYAEKSAGKDSEMVQQNTVYDELVC